MTTAEIITIVGLVIAAIPGVLAYLNQRKATNAAVADTLTGSAERLVQRHEKEIEQLERKIKSLQHEVEIQAASLENATAANLKQQLYSSIIVNQLRAAGFEPVIEPSEIDTMAVDDLRLIAEAMSNTERRRDSLRKTQQLSRDKAK